MPMPRTSTSPDLFLDGCADNQKNRTIAFNNTGSQAIRVLKEARSLDVGDPSLFTTTIPRPLSSRPPRKRTPESSPKKPSPTAWTEKPNKGKSIRCPGDRHAPVENPDANE
jgi:hypothetical protein